ncbi:MAG: 5'-deoxyadenosine deaminase [Myxococcales bacterium]|nr:5'-deoxyadenosine deaminase [Myxococcales bacterium]
MTEQDDLLLRGATVVTVDPARRVLVGDVRVRGGRIVAVGGRSRRPAKRIVDLRGHALIPGIVQAHVHLCQALFRGMADDLPLLPWLAQRIWPLEGAHDTRSLRASARLGLAEMIRAGTTTILDMGTVHHHDAVFDVLAQSGIRAFSGKAMMDVGDQVPKTLRETTASSLKESHRLRDRWNGAAEGRLRYAYAPRFILSCSEALMREVGEATRSGEALAHSHAAEHADERAAVKARLGMDDVAALESYGLAGPHTILAHGVQLRAAEMKRIAKLGTRFVHCPSANLKLASGIADVKAMRDAGMVVGLGADGAPCNNRMDPWTELRQAALLAKVRRDDAAALPAHQAFELATIEGARALGIDADVGSIEVGKKADLVALRLDDLHHEPGGDVYGRLVYSATPADVRHVFVDGRALLDAGELVTLDREKVLADARREGKKTLQRAGIVR